jgi:hypothetical protein
MAWILDAVGCSFSCREGSVGMSLKNVMLWCKNDTELIYPKLI